MIIGLHHIVHGYGFWGVNDIRGSGSYEVREEKFEDLGPIHQGRKRVQPSREALRAYSKQVQERLKFPLLWFDARTRIFIANAVRDVCKSRGYTLWALAVMRNHLHALTRVHRDKHDVQWGAIADGTREAARALGVCDADHPVWSLRPYTTFCDTPEGVKGRVKYIEDNPENAGLPRQCYDFVKPYDGFPFHKKR